MQTVEDMMAEAKALHDENMRLLAGTFFDKIPLQPGVSKDEAMAILKEDILRMKALMKRYGRRDDADRT
ncbi:hypothetical protein FJ872_01575 [Mesorhizobium sp. B2-5-9]|uniref:hypothetical protein n=1 Tax=Mesorhizobium sp. B2-5-9 TaxID=2589921 RepID=UPI001128AA1A|nr:hypothetical protein [Mesorhizobium sp. B2-5-9]TPK24689.1 hypothetical protein FJ872_01575 [Mesorhizobium sp. B2-5-9]